MNGNAACRAVNFSAMCAACSVQYAMHGLAVNEVVRTDKCGRACAPTGSVSPLPTSTCIVLTTTKPPKAGPPYMVCTSRQSSALTRRHHFTAEIAKCHGLLTHAHRGHMSRRHRDLPSPCGKQATCKGCYMAPSQPGQRTYEEPRGGICSRIALWVKFPRPDTHLQEIRMQQHEARKASDGGWEGGAVTNPGSVAPRIQATDAWATSATLRTSRQHSVIG